MEQGAIAPATPAANRTVLRKAWRAGLFALSFQTGLATAVAGENPVISDKSLVIPPLSFSQTISLERVAVNFHFVPPPTAKSVLPQRVRVGPIAKPRRSAKAATPPVKAVAPRKPAVLQAVVREGAPRAPQSATFLFGTRGKSVSLTPVTKRWARALGELETEASVRHQDRAYAAIFNQVKNKRRGLQIPKINYMVNRLLAYREDVQIWNTGEYWASPMESLARRAGDCEDYAILKYALLRDLGVKDADMRIVVLMDTAARQHHAVLSVRHEGKWLILDNRFSRIRFERDLPNYQPLYTVNAAGEWSHTQDKGTPVRLAARLKSANK